MGDDIEELLAQCETMQEQLSEKDDEIAELRDRNVQLEEELLGSGKGGDLELRDELRDLRGRLETAEDQLEKAMDRAKEQESRARDANLQTKAMQMDKLKLEAELQKEQERADNAAEELTAMRHRSEQAAESEGRLGAREKTNKKTLIKTLGENEDLRKEVAGLEGVVQTLYQAVNDKDAVAAAAAADLKTADLERQDAESEVDELKRLLREKESEITAQQEELSAVSELEAEIKETVSGKIEKWKQKVREAQKEVEEEKRRQAALQKKCNSLLLQSGVHVIEQQLVASQEAAKATQRELVGTKQQLEESHNEILTVARENEALKLDQGKFIDLALEKERAEMERLKAVVASRDALLDEERARYKELYEEKGDLEEELQEREFTLAEYERGHGLSEAVLKQKKLKGDIKRRDKEIRRINQALSERISAHEKLFETCRRLKNKAGLPESFQFDELELQEGMKGQSERLQGLIHELEVQNDALENDRLRLLEALRKNALNVSDKGMKFYGLSAEQVILVNEFIDNLKDGRTDLPLNDKSLMLMQETKELKRQIKDLERDLAAAELSMERGGIGNGNNSLLNLARQQHGGSSDSLALGSGGGNNPDFDRHLERMAQEQMNMVAEMKLEMQSFMQQQQQHVSRSGGGGGSSSPVSSGGGGYERLMNVLESKLQAGGIAAMDRGHVEGLRDELERQSAINESLNKHIEILQQQQQQPQQQPQQQQQWSSSTAADNNQSLNTSITQSKLKLGAVGSRFYDVQTASLKLPPEEWADQYLILQKQLVLCMEQVVSREKEVARTERSLRTYEEKAEVLAAQVGALYREHADARASWNKEASGLRKEADEARNERDALRAKARRLDTLCAVLESEGEATPADHVKELTRKIAVLEVNEVVLARKYNLIAAEERVLRHDSELMQAQTVQTESALRERIVYLEEWKAGAQATLGAMERKLENCVPRETHEQSIRKLVSVRHSYRELLAREAALRGRTTGSHALRRRVHELDVKLDIANADLAKSRQEQAANGIATAVVDPAADPAASGNVNELARLKGESVEKEILLQSTLKRAEIFERRARELTTEIAEETQRADSSEAAADTARAIITRLEAEIVELNNNYSGGATAAERTVLQERIDELEGLFKSLQRENVRFRGLADIASAQVQMFDANNQAKLKELEELRTQLRQVNARSDDDAIIGKVQHELTTTKVSYHMFVRKFDLAKASIRRGELERIQLESQLDAKDKMTQITRDEARARIFALQGALEELDVLSPLVNYNNSNKENAASNKQSTFIQREELKITGLERLSETIARLGESAEHSEEALRRSETSRRTLEGKIECQHAELESARAIVADLRQRVFAEDGENGGSGSISEQRGLAKRLLDLNEELKNTRVNCLRQKRELQIVREEKIYLEKLREKDEEHMIRLEESVANTENALRRREDEKTFRMAADQNAKDGFGLPLVAVRPQAHTVGGFLENDMNKSNNNNDPLKEEERAEQNKAVLMELMELRSTLRQAEMREEQLNRKLQKQQMSISFLKRRLGVEGLDHDLYDKDEEDGEQHYHHDQQQIRDLKRKNDNGKYYEADARKLQVAAQQTIASLKETVGRKNAAIEGIRKKMELLRSTSLAERQRDQAEIQRLTEKLYEDNKAEISKLRSAYENVYVSNTGSGGNAANSEGGDSTGLHRDMLERLEEADVMLERKDRRVLELEQVAEELSILRQKAEDKAAKAAEVAQRLGDKVQLISKSGTGPEQLIKQLRGQLLAKDKKLHGLRAAVVALKNEFVKSEEEHEGELVEKDRQLAMVTTSGGDIDVAEVAAPDIGGGASKRQLQALKERVERMREDLEDQRHRENKLKKDNERLSRQLNEHIDSQVDREDFSTSVGKQVRVLEREVDNLKCENRRLHEALANNFAAADVSLFASSSSSQMILTGEEKQLGEQQRRAHRGLGASSSNKNNEEKIAELARKLQVVQAQNAAFRSAAKTSGMNLTSQTLSSATNKWQADKRLERQVTVLKKKLQDTKRELDAEQSKSGQAKSLFERVSRENQTLKAKLASSSTHNSGINNNNNHASCEEQAQNFELMRETQVEQRAEINSLTLEVRATRERALELEEEADHLRRRLEEHGSGAGVNYGGRDSLEAAEDNYAVQDELRAQLALSRKECRAVESELLERENSILELRFELEQAEASGRQQLSLTGLSDLSHNNTITSANNRKPGERFKRERDLENVVESMKKVVTKLQADNGKLRRSAEGGMRAATLAKQLAAAKTDKEELNKANALLNRRLQDRGEMTAAKIRLQDALRSTKRQLQDARAALAEKEAYIDTLRTGAENVEAIRNNARYSQDETVSNLRSRLTEQQELILHLRSGGDGGSSGATMEMQRLRKENQCLLNELNAFDLDFFEEIEDLKFKYSQAVEENRQLRSKR